MAYRVSIYIDGEPINGLHSWWRRFIESKDYCDADEFDNLLRKFRAKDIFGTGFIEFESEDDFAMFLLRFA